MSPSLKRGERYEYFMMGIDHKGIIFSALLIWCCIKAHAQQITASVRVHRDAVNGVVINMNGETLVVYGDPAQVLKKASMVLFTHYRRDVIWAGRRLVEKGARAIAPRNEKEYFVNGDSIWSAFKRSRFHDYENQSSRIAINPLEITRFVAGGDIIKWNGIDVHVLSTPGYTRGAVSYLMNIDGRRIIFTGDLIYGDGKILDLYSLQDSLEMVDGYHGYAVRLGQLISSLERIALQKPDLLIPSRGPVIKDPQDAIKKLTQRIRLLYRNYLSITAQRWNHTDRMIIMSDHVLGHGAAVDWMPFSSVIQNDPPAWYKHIGSSNLILSGDSSAFLIDCGMKQSLQELGRLKKEGRLKSVDGIFITHYHDDHTDLINEAVREFGCPVYATKELKEILESPASFRMPCLPTDPIVNLTVAGEGQKIKWKDFVMTFFYFPGQTLYHDALLAEKSNGEAIFFTGDSFSPAGVDDYCMQNRNWLHDDAGHLYCLDLLRKLPEHVLLSNEHVRPLFRFSPQQLDYMSAVLHERNIIIQDMVPWDDVNYAVDENWCSIFPYGVKAKAGETMPYTARIFNHSPVEKEFTIRPRAPEGFRVRPAMASVKIKPGTEGRLAFNVKVPGRVTSAVSLVTLDIKFDDWDLRDWTEAMIETQR